MTIDYDGLTFRPVPAGGSDAVGHYHQHRDVVWAEFSGGPVRTGRLVGRVAADGTITGAYCQVMIDGQVVAGSCTSTPHLLDDGRLLLTEHWRRIDGSTGVSRIERVREPLPAAPPVDPARSAS